VPAPGSVELLPYALCDVDDVRRILATNPSAGYSDAAQDFLRWLINGFTDMAQDGDACGREWAYGARTEYFDGGQPFVQIAAPPIALDANGVPLLAVYDDAAHLWTSALTLYDAYEINLEWGQIRILYGIFSTGNRTVKVAYTGGLVTPAVENATPAVIPWRLRMACALQVASWFQRRKELSLQSVSFPQGGAISLGDPTKLVTFTAKTLEHYRIHRNKF